MFSDFLSTFEKACRKPKNKTEEREDVFFFIFFLFVLSCFFRILRKEKEQKRRNNNDKHVNFGREEEDREGRNEKMQVK